MYYAVIYGCDLFLPGPLVIPKGGNVTPNLRRTTLNIRVMASTFASFYQA